MTPNTVLRLGFTTSEEKTKLFGVKNPAGNLTAADIIGAMDEMIDSNVLSTTAGDLTGRKSARLTTTVVTEIDLP